MRGLSESAADVATGSLGRPRLVWNWWPWLLAVAFAGSSIFLYRAPTAATADARADEFSAARAFRHVEIIARAPHPRGSPQNAAVRDYILAELAKLGFDAQVQRGVSSRGSNQPRVPIENIVARKTGSASTRAVMLAAHYDSVARAPGAGDNGAGVAALLETARALGTGGPLRNDVMLLFTDGEELGLLGAQVFVAEHPWSKEIGVLLNFDARGNRGPSLMFETSSRNGALIREFARAAPHITSSSITDAIYRQMPNGTDFTVYRHAGMAGLNFAFIGGGEHYHRPTDDPAHLSRATLQHTGGYALSLVRHFGGMTLPIPETAARVYFTIVPPLFFHYPISYVLPLAGMLVALAGAVLAIAVRRKLVTVRGVVVAMLGLLTAVAIAGFGGWGAFAIRAGITKTFGTFHATAVLALALALGAPIAVAALLSRWCSAGEKLAAGIILWTLLAAVVAFLLPAGSYLFYWPALAGWLVLAIWIGRFQRSAVSAHITLMMPWYVGFAGWLGVVILCPTCFLLWQALPSALPIMGVIAVLLGWLVLPITGRQIESN